MQCNRSVQTVSTKMWTNLLLCITLFYYRLPTNLRAGNFFCAVWLFTVGVGPMWPLSTIHWTSLDRDPTPSQFWSLWTWDLTGQGPFQTCSLQDPLIGAEIWWLLKYIPLAQVSGTHPTGMFSCFFIKQYAQQYILAYYIWRLLYLFILRPSQFFGS